MVTNARSLAPKIQSMIDNFSELDLNVAIVAESWLKPGESLEREINDLSEGENIGIIHKEKQGEDEMRVEELPFSSIKRG